MLGLIGAARRCPSAAPTRQRAPTGSDHAGPRGGGSTAAAGEVRLDGPGLAEAGFSLHV